MVCLAVTLLFLFDSGNLFSPPARLAPKNTEWNGHWVERLLGFELNEFVHLADDLSINFEKFHVLWVRRARFGPKSIVCFHGFNQIIDRFLFLISFHLRISFFFTERFTASMVLNAASKSL